jgi:hypothetical protein
LVIFKFWAFYNWNLKLGIFMWSSAPISKNILTITLNFDSNDYRI